MSKETITYNDVSIIKVTKCQDILIDSDGKITGKKHCEINKKWIDTRNHWQK